MEDNDSTNHTENLAQQMQDDSETQEVHLSSETPNFWNPINFEEITSRFARTESYNHRYTRSFVYQPDRVSLNSHDAQNPTVLSPTNYYGYTTNGTLSQETFSPFTILFQKPLLRVKSLQLLSAIIPNPQASIPDDERVFSYYRLRNLYSSVNNNGSGGQLWQGNYSYASGDVVVWDAPSALVGTILVFQTVWTPPNTLAIYTLSDPTFIPNGSKIYVSNPPSYLYTVFTVVQTFPGGLGNWRIVVNTTTNSFLNTNTLLTAYAATSIVNYWVSNSLNNLNNPPTVSTNWVNVAQSGDSTNIVWNAWNITTTYAAGDYVFYTKNSTDRATYFYQSQAGGNVGNNPETIPEYWTQISRSASTSPNWFDISPLKLTSTRGGIGTVALYNSTTPPELFPPSTYPNALTAKNTAFSDYASFLVALQSACTSTGSSTIANDISFQLNGTLNKIQFVPQNQIAWVNGVYNDGFYYLLVGWDDPNLATFYAKYTTQKPTYSLNLRSGFTWNGYFSLPSNPWNGYSGNSVFAGQIANYFTPWAGAGQPINIFLPLTRTFITANSFANLVYSQSIRIYCDITQGSTQDSAGNPGLLSVVPMSATALGITFYQNNFNNPLTKVPEQLQRITISMKTDSGDDYILPSSASVSLELGITYE